MSKAHNSPRLDTAAQQLYDWLRTDEHGRAILGLFAADDPSAEQRLTERLGAKDAPVGVTTVVSGGTIQQLVNIARAEAVHFHSYPYAERRLEPGTAAWTQLVRDYVSEVREKFEYWRQRYVVLP